MFGQIEKYWSIKEEIQLPSLSNTTSAIPIMSTPHPKRNPTVLSLAISQWFFQVIDDFLIKQSIQGKKQMICMHIARIFCIDNPIQ